jgi:hypothetical protein
MPDYEVVVGNIGYVHRGNNPVEANRHFSEYRTLSRDNYGRAAGEPVVLMKDGEPIREYEGTINQE